MSRSRILLAALLLLLASLACPAVAAEPSRILAVRAGEAGPSQVVLELERRAEPLVFTLDEPMRLVVELDNARWALQQAPASHGIAAGWRFGRKDGRAARMIVDLAQPARVRRVAYEIGTGRGGTRLVIELEPVSRATFTADLRNTDEGLLRQAEARLAGFLESIAARTGTTVAARRLARFEPVAFDRGITDLVEEVARGFGLGVRRMTSGAGHDAQMMARICPSGMIFVPSVRGISHNPAEHTAEVDLVAGANVLLRTMLVLAAR